MASIMNLLLWRPLCLFGAFFTLHFRMDRVCVPACHTNTSATFFWTLMIEIAFGYPTTVHPFVRLNMLPSQCKLGTSTLSITSFLFGQIMSHNGVPIWRNLALLHVRSGKQNSVYHHRHRMELCTLTIFFRFLWAVTACSDSDTAMWTVVCL